MKLEGKRGLSPVIATLLLVAIALVLAMIIFFWANSHMKEQIEKNEQDIALVCEHVTFTAEAFGSGESGGGELWIENTGNVPIWGVEVRLKKTGDVTGAKEFNGKTVDPGQTLAIKPFTSAGEGDKIIVSPILIGESKSNSEKVPYVCDVEYGVETIVGA